MRPSAVLAIFIGLIAAVANAADLFFLDFFGPLIVLPYALGSFAGVGLILTLLRPGHAVGWLFLVAGACFALQFTLGAYGWRALAAAPGTLPGGEIAAWITSWVWPIAIGSVVGAVVLFPTGRPRSRRWASLLVTVVGTLAAMTVVAAFAPARIEVFSGFSTALGDTPTDPADLPSITNPFGVIGPIGDVLLAARPLIEAVTGLPLLFVVLASLAVRYRRSAGAERQQLKWFLYAATLSFVLILGSFVGPKGIFANLAWASGMVALGLIPVAAGIAILRYRLYDIDRLINRTLVYGSLSATLLATYLLAVLGLSALLRPLTGSSDLAVAGSTLAVVALFGPLRVRLQRFVDRRFYRSRYDAARTLDAFGARLRDKVDLDDVRADLLDAVHDTVRPAHASVWLRGRARGGP